MKAPLLLALCIVTPVAAAGTVWDYLPGIVEPDLLEVQILSTCKNGFEPICRIACDVMHLMPDWYNKIIECLP